MRRGLSIESRYCTLALFRRMKISTSAAMIKSLPPLLFVVSADRFDLPGGLLGNSDDFVFLTIILLYQLLSPALNSPAHLLTTTIMPRGYLSGASSAIEERRRTWIIQSEYAFYFIFSLGIAAFQDTDAKQIATEYNPRRR